METIPKVDGSAARKRFLAALCLYIVWVATLAGLALVSGYRPASKPSAIQGR